MSNIVYEYQYKDIFTLKVSGKNAGRYEAYCQRINAEVNSDASFVEESNPTGKTRQVPTFFETRYFVRCDFHCQNIRNVFVNHKMASVADAFDFDGKTLVGTLDFINTPGKFRFEIVWYRGEVRESAIFDWVVVSEKLNVQKDYTEIVKTIEKNTPGLVRAFLAKSSGEAGLIDNTNTSDTIWADIFGKIADRYQRACEWISNKPHLKYLSEVEYKKAGKVKRWTPNLVNSFAMMDKGKRNVAYFRTEHISPQVDTIENRFVKFTLKSISDRIKSFVELCKTHTTINEKFINDFEKRGKCIKKIMHKSFFAGVGRFTGFRQENMVLQRKQGYAEIYATWLMLQKSIDTTKTGFSFGHRPISALYEFWCFLRIAEILEIDFNLGVPEGKVEGATVFDDLFEEPDYEKINTASLSALSYKFKSQDGTVISLLYQQNYSNNGSNENLAFYNPQRPDIVLIIEKGTNKYTYLFDAKYRIDSRNGLDASPSEPINDMHRYRDAILYRSQDENHKISRQVIGAYVLYPGRPLPQSYDYAKLIETENIGAIPLLPGEDGSAALKSFICEILNKNTPSSHLQSDIPTRGTSVVVGECFNEISTFLTDAPIGGVQSAAVQSHIYPAPVTTTNKPENIRWIFLSLSNHAVRMLKVRTDGYLGSEWTGEEIKRTYSEFENVNFPQNQCYHVWEIDEVLDNN